MGSEKQLTYIDLFSGIGGFTLAAEWAGFRTVVFCEKEKFCQKVLKKHWPEIPLIPEIRDFDGKKYRGATLLTGGFPCQPFSVAGQRRGKEDDRYLWPEMLRVISEAKPHWILAENVPGIFRMALDTVLADLEGEGYVTGTFIIPACGLNAPHRRNRVWIVGYTTNNGYSRRPEKARRTERSSKQRRVREFEGANSHAPNSKSDFRKTSRLSGGEKSQDTRLRISDKNESGITSWQENWYEIATHFCRVDDGVSDRVHRLKALGNAIVPQIAYEIIKNIAWIEKELRK